MEDVEGVGQASEPKRLIQAERAALRLHMHRVMHCISAADLADRLGVSRAAMYRYERGEIIKLETVAQIAVLLRMTFEQVIAPVSDAEKRAMVGALAPSLLRGLFDDAESVG